MSCAPACFERILISVAVFVVGTLGQVILAQRIDRDAAVQEFLNDLSADVRPETLEARLGAAESVRVMTQVAECYRDGALEALCTADQLAESPADRSLTCEKIRTQHVYAYDSLGIRFIFLDDPWRLRETHLTNAGFSIDGLRPGESATSARDLFDALPLPGKLRDGSECSSTWPGMRIHHPCGADADWSIVRVVKLNPEFPTGCWKSFRGMYE